MKYLILSFQKFIHLFILFLILGISPVIGNDYIPKYEETKPAENVFFSPTKRNYAALSKAFTSENPLEFIEDEKIRKDLDFVISQAENPDEERRKWALAAYFSQMRMQELNFCHGNLDGLIARYNNGQPQSVKKAFYSTKQIFLQNPSILDNIEFQIVKILNITIQELAIIFYYSIFVAIFIFFIIIFPKKIIKKIKTFLQNQKNIRFLIISIIFVKLSKSSDRSENSDPSDNS